MKTIFPCRLRFFPSLFFFAFAVFFSTQVAAQVRTSSRTEVTHDVYVSPETGARKTNPGYQEEILSFHSDIVVHPDASMTVTEEIRVTATGAQIKRGIYRDFPTRYKDRFGGNVVVGFKVVDVKRDNTPEPYSVQSRSNGKRVYIGDKNVYLQPGEYTYTITYITTRQLGFFPEHDELYWNVTGNGWSFPIRQASATIRLPGQAAQRIKFINGYTGPMGSRESAIRAQQDNFSDIQVETTRALRPREGLTIAVGWEKGILVEPTAFRKFMYFIEDNPVVFWGMLGWIAVIFYYLIVWLLVGIDPVKGTIIPLFHPPENLSPAAMRYIVRMGYDDRAFTAAIISMAVKGYIRIEEEPMGAILSFLGGKTYFVKKVGQEPFKTLAAEEKKVGENLFYIDDEIKFDQENHRIFRAAINRLKESLASRCGRINFVTNQKYLDGGICFSLLTAFLLGRPVFASSDPKFLDVGMFVLTLVILFVVNSIFYHLIKAPTMSGRRLMDHIEGFKMFLSVTEKNRLNVLNPPEKTPELFEKYLPYAFALDVEQKWAEQFHDVFDSMKQSGREYHPAWYMGRGGVGFSARDFSSSLGNNLHNSISSSAKAPGSSSGGGGGGSSGGGSSGGGSSGGGGGGGGGGGW